ncbi:MAG: Fe2+-dependent dioxygenase [Pseudomonadota bacterium]
MIQIANVLPEPDCDAITDALGVEDCWISGESTAGGQARQVKHNLQADLNTAPVRGVIEKIVKAISTNTIVKAYAQPKQIVRPMINRFDREMAYGNHVDAAFIDGQPTDLSFTLFLTDPDTYEGGDLIIQNDGSEDVIKLAKGHLVLYSAAHVHEVTMVTKGCRIAAVGWITSRIASAEARAALFDIEQVLAAMDRMEDRAAWLKLTNARNRLLRLFSR